MDSTVNFDVAPAKSAHYISIHIDGSSSISEHSGWKRYWQKGAWAESRRELWGVASFKEPRTPQPPYHDFVIWFTLISGVINFGSKLAKICQLAAQNVHCPCGAWVIFLFYPKPMWSPWATPAYPVRVPRRDLYGRVQARAGCPYGPSLGTKPYYSITQVPLHIWPLSQYKRPSELDTQASTGPDQIHVQIKPSKRCPVRSPYRINPYSTHLCVE